MKLTPDNFNRENIQITQTTENNNIKFTCIKNTAASNGAFVTLNAPKPSSCYSLKSRMQIRNISANKIRVRLETQNIIYNCYLNFFDKSKLVFDNNVFDVWHVNNYTTIVDIDSLDLHDDDVRLSFHILDNDDLEISEFILEKYKFEFLEKSINATYTLFHDIEFSSHARKLCSGTGLEIGALHKPFNLDANVLYVDRFSTNELINQYKHDSNVPTDQIRRVHIISKDGRYPYIDDSAFDFVINSHVLEHVPNPADQIIEWLRIIKPLGILYMIIPNKNFCFDRNRSTTTLEHLIKEHEEHIDFISIEHYRDYITNAVFENGHQYDKSDDSINNKFLNQTSIHVHTFDPESLKLFIGYITSVVKAEVVNYTFNGLHMHCALRKLI